MPYTRPDGERMLGGYSAPRYLDWAVLVERSETTAYRAIRNMLRSLLLWVGIGSVAAVAGAFVFSRRISRPIVEIDRVAQEVGKGNFDVRVAPMRSGDEITHLGVQINNMIAGLIERERVKSENVLLLEMTEKLRALNEQKNKFLGMAAHDLRNPIGGILGYSEMLLEEDLPEDLHTVAGKIETSSKFMLRLLNDLLDISQIESGKLELHLEETDLGALLRQNVDLNRIAASKKDIRVELSCPEDLPRLRIDPSKIEQVVSNLISNAVKYSFPNTTVSVELLRVEQEVLLRVRDQGQGIPADELHKLFQEFQKTSVKSTAGERSTGLGLAIVKKIVEGHGGRIGVESEVGKGSTFYVNLPLRTDAARVNERKEERVKIHVPVHFSVTSGGAAQAGAGTALDLSSGGTLIESSVPLRVGELIRFSLRLADASVTGTGKLIHQLSPKHFGVTFQSFDADGRDQVQAFLAAACAPAATGAAAE
jgi:signal transduction histidine kinase